MRALAESDPKPNTENYSVKEAISEGDMVAKKTIEKLFENQILQLRDKKGIIIDGYPRDIEQIRDFEKKVSYIHLKRKNMGLCLEYNITNFTVQTKTIYHPPGLFQASIGTWTSR